MGTVSNIFDSIKGSLTSIVIDLFVKIVTNQIHNEDIKAAGIEHGMWISANAKGKLGASWEGIETVIQDKAAAYLEGLNAGLNADDAV